ncbi:MAG: LamG-like jellyroll fold domain-containing protein [Candidatus Micrarchaeota archaeon]
MGFRRELRGYFIFANFIALAVAIIVLLFAFYPASIAGEPLSDSLPTIINFQALDVGSTSANLSWETDVFTNSTIFYKKEAFGGSETSIPLVEIALFHSYVISLLETPALYSAHVEACTYAGCVNSPAIQFTTLSEPVFSPTPSVGASPSPAATPVPSPSISPTPSIIPSAAPTPSPSETPSAQPSAVSSSTPTIDANATPSVLPTPAPSPQIKALSSKSFSRNVGCPKCGQHKAPPLTEVSITVSVEIFDPLQNAILSDMFPTEWQIVDIAGGIVTEISPGISKISWDVSGQVGTISKTYVLKTPQRTIPPTKYDFGTSLSAEGIGIDDGGYFIILSDPVAEPGGQTELRAQSCLEYNNAEFGYLAICDGTYPSNLCTAGNDLVDCNDANSETQTVSVSGDVAGREVQYLNSTITNCGAIFNVTVCYEWWRTAGTVASCSINALGGRSGTSKSVSASCPGTSADPGLTCTNVMASTWVCKDFFSGGSQSTLTAQLSQSGAGTRTVTWDALFYNVSYFTNTCDTITESRKYEAGTINASTINSAGTCFNITTNNVILDCGGALILGNGTSGYGINITNANNVVIKNCIIKNFSRGISAQNAINLTLINNTFLNETNFGISITHSSNSNLTSQLMSDFPALFATGNGRNITGLYMNNVSNTFITKLSMFRLTAANTTGGGIPGTGFGIFTEKNQNNSFSHIWAERINGGKPASTAAATTGIPAGNATGLFSINSNDSVFINTTIVGVTSFKGGEGGSDISTSPGGPGGFSTGLTLFNSFNNSFANLSVRNISSGEGGLGSDDSSVGNGAGGNGGNGGEAIFLYLQGSANSLFTNFSFINISSYGGGNGGLPFSGQVGGNGGLGGNGYGIYLAASSFNNTFQTGVIRTIYAGKGGDGGGPGAGTRGNGGIGGNSSLIFMLISNNNTFIGISMNTSLGGANGTGRTNSAPGKGSGIFISSSNFSVFERVAATNISGGIGNSTLYGNTSAISLFGSSLNNFTNSSFTELYLNPLSYSINSQSNSQNNLFVNSTFNHSANGWGTGVNTFNVSWYVLVNITDAAGEGINNAFIQIFNSTSAAIPQQKYFTGSPTWIWKTLSEYDASGTFTYPTYCIPQSSITCYNPYNFSGDADGYKPNATGEVNFTASGQVRLILPNTFPTHNAPTFNPNPPETGSNLTCLNQSTADADGDPVYNIYTFRFNASGGLANESLLLYLPFDKEMTYSPIVKDYSRHNSTLYIQVAARRPAWFNYANATYGGNAVGAGGVYVDGSGWFTASISSAPQLDVKDNFTWMTWFNATAFAAANKYIVSTEDTINQDGYNIYLQSLSGDMHIACQVKNSSGIMRVNFRAPSGVWLNRQVFAACSYNTTALILYINGTEVNRSLLDTPARTQTTATSNFSVGIKGSANANPFSGSIDEVRIYNSTLSPEQIDLLYQMRQNATAAQELAVNMNATCCVTPTDTYADGLTKCVSDLVITPTASTSFTVFTLGLAGANYTNSKLALPGNYTEGYFFNSTSQFAQLVAPCGNADGVTDCQNGPARPAYRVRNTANANMTIWLNLSSSVLASGVRVCANSTSPAGCGTNTIPLCDLKGEGNINASAWFLAASNLGTDSICFDANVTIYANFTNVAPGVPIVRVLTINSTLT